MTEGHRARLIASLSSFEDAIADITTIAREGRSPTSGSRLTPLPDQEWKKLNEILTRARQRLLQAVHAFAPSYLTEREEPESLAGTLFRLAILLRTLEEETVDNLHPDRLASRYGPLSSAEAETLRQLTEDLRRDVREARELLDHLRAG